MSQEPSARTATPPLLVCMQCGFTHAEFRARGLLGCPSCYDHFGETLHADMLHIHPLLYRLPPLADEPSSTRDVMDAAALREQLADALRHERYEEAAALRRLLDAGAALRESAPVTSPAQPPLPAFSDPSIPAHGSAATSASANAATFAGLPVPWAAAQSKDTPELLFVRVTARRNFAGFPFWVSCPLETCARLSETFRAVARARGFDPALRLADAGSDAIGVLRERMALPERPASFPGKRDFKLWAPGISPGEHLLFGETEHWSHTRLAHPGVATPLSFDLFHHAAEIVHAFARDRHDPVFAHLERWGFPASHPAHAGHGLQVEAGVHIPALAGRRRIPQIAQALAAIGCELQPLSLREPGAAEAGFFRLSTRGSLGLDGEPLVGRFRDHVKQVLDAEREAAERITLNPRARHEREDQAYRAFHLLQEARRMESPELQLLVSHVRAGVSAGLFPATLLPKLETLRVWAGPFHLAARAELEDRTAGGGADHPDAPRRRAALARRLLSEG